MLAAGAPYRRRKFLQEQTFSISAGARECQGRGGESSFQFRVSSFGFPRDYLLFGCHLERGRRPESKDPTPPGRPKRKRFSTAHVHEETGETPWHCGDGPGVVGVLPTARSVTVRTISCLQAPSSRPAGLSFPGASARPVRLSVSDPAAFRSSHTRGRSRGWRGKCPGRCACGAPGT